MHIPLQHWFCPNRPSQWHRRMTEDADRLLAEFGPAAYEVAADRSWREDVGLLTSSDAGHWSRVTLEIGRRLAVLEAPPSAVLPSRFSEGFVRQASLHIH